MQQAEPTFRKRPTDTRTNAFDEDQFRALADAVPALIWISGADKGCNFFNQSWLEFTGRSLAQELGDGWSQGLHPEDLAHCLETYRTAFDARRPFQVEYRLRRHDGVYCWILDHGRPRFTKAGEFLGYIGFCTDITHQREAEMRADAERERLKIILTCIGDGVIVTDAHAQTIFLNPVAEELTGWKQQDARGLGIETVLKLVNEDTERTVENPACVALREGRRVGLANHTVAISKDGSRRPIDDSAAPVQDRQGRIVGSVLVFRDVTARRRAEEMNRRLAAIVGTADDAIIGKDLRGVVTSWNAAAERIFGFTAQEMIGRSITTIIPPERQEEEVHILKTLRQGERVDHFETVRVTKDGRRILVFLTVSPIKNSEGQIIGVSKIARDITDQRKAEEARLYLAAIVESSDDAIIGKNLQGIITSWNTGAERIFGYTAPEAVGQPVSLLIPADKQAEDAKILERIRQGERIDPFETLRRTKEGRLVDISLTVSPVKDKAGRIVGISKIARDITEHKRMERALQDAQAQLQAYAQDLEQTVQDRTARLQAAVVELEAFSYSVSHDLRAPLRAMQQYSEALLEDYGDKLDEQGRHFLKRITASTARLDNLIREVLTYSRIIRANITLQPVEIGKLLPEIMRQYPSLHTDSAAIQIEEPLIPVLGNETFLTQALSNLLINAVKFVAPGKRPRIRVWTERRTHVPENADRSREAPSRRALGPLPVVRLWIEDNGIGIAPEHHERVFGMFERVHSEAEYEGTGIGLAIVRKAVQRMDGRVGVESKLGEGSRFWIELPALPQIQNQSLQRVLGEDRHDTVAAG